MVQEGIATGKDTGFGYFKDLAFDFQNSSKTFGMKILLFIFLVINY